MATMLLQGKRILVTGVLTPASLPFAVARQAQQDGAEVVLTSFGRAMRLTERCAARLPEKPTDPGAGRHQGPDFSALVER